MLYVWASPSTLREFLGCLLSVLNAAHILIRMGLTPVSGLPGSSRSGDVDPSLIFHYISDAAAESPNNTKELHITKVCHYAHVCALRT